MIEITSVKMTEMLKTVFANSDRGTRRFIKKYVKRQRNPFKENYGMFMAVDKETMILLNSLYSQYLLMPESVRPYMSIKVRHTNKGE